MNKKMKDNEKKILEKVLKENSFIKVSDKKEKIILVTGKKGSGKTFAINKTLEEYNAKVIKDLNGKISCKRKDKCVSRINFIGETFDSYDDFLYKTISFKKTSWKETIEFIYKIILPFFASLLAIAKMFTANGFHKLLMWSPLIFAVTLIITLLVLFLTNLHWISYGKRFKSKEIIIFEDMNRFNIDKSVFERSSIIQKINTDKRWEEKVVFIEYDENYEDDDILDPRFISNHKIVHNQISNTIEKIMNISEKPKWIRQGDLNSEKLLKMLVKKEDHNIRNIKSKIENYGKIFNDNKAYFEFQNIDIKSLIFIGEIFRPLNRLASIEEVNSTFYFMKQNLYLGYEAPVNLEWYKERKNIPSWFLGSDGNIDEVMGYYIPEGKAIDLTHRNLEDIYKTIDEFINPYESIDISNYQDLKSNSPNLLVSKFDIEQDEKKKENLISIILNSKELMFKYDFFIKKLIENNNYIKIIKGKVFELELFNKNYDGTDLTIGNEEWVDKFLTDYKDQSLTNDMILVLLFSMKAKEQNEIKEILINHSLVILDYISSGFVTKRDESFRTISIYILKEYCNLTEDEIKQLLSENIEMFKGKCEVIPEKNEDNTISGMITVPLKDYLKYNEDLTFSEIFEVFDSKIPKIPGKVRSFNYENEVKNDTLKVTFTLNKSFLRSEGRTEKEINSLIQEIEIALMFGDIFIEVNDSNDKTTFEYSKELTIRKQTQK